MQLSVSGYLVVNIRRYRIFTADSKTRIRKLVMKSKSAQWILWAVAMVIFSVITLSGHRNWLGLAIVAVAVVWNTVVPSAHSRQQ